MIIVEDDAEIRNLLQKMLARHYDVFAAPEGQLAMLSAKKSPPDLFILDVALPGIDGFDLASLIRSETSLHRVPIIFITALDSAAFKIRGIQAGAKHYITKPFNVSDVMDKVGRALG